MRHRLFILILCAIPASLAGQTSGISKSDSVSNVSYLLKTATYDGQTYPQVELKEITIYGKMTRSARFDYKKHARLVYNVKRVYPYSILVREELNRVNRLLETMPNEKDRRNFMQQYEKDIFNQYKDDMEHLTFTQGKILIKLIDRETMNTSYDLIREYRGKLTASFWQAVAKFFGANLKTSYDPFGEDYLIEQVVTEIEAGRL